MSAHKPLDHFSIATPQSVAAPSPIPALRRVRPGLITDWHLGLLAIIYVRQSSPQQILDHRESRERQYELVNFALALGWPRDRILIIDDDWDRATVQQRFRSFEGRRFCGVNLNVFF